MRKNQKQVLGRWDRIDLPEIGLEAVEAKVDTGAYTCALHVTQVKKFQIDDQNWVEFKLIHPKTTAGEEPIRLPLLARRRIKSSTGVSRLRFIIKTKVVLFGKSILTEFSLSDRSHMDFPILLGRKLLNRRFVVDVSKKDLSFRNKKPKNNSPS